MKARGQQVNGSRAQHNVIKSVPERVGTDSHIKLQDNTHVVVEDLQVD